MKNAYLYVFSDGQIQVGRPKFSQLVIYSGKRANKYEKGIIREKKACIIRITPIKINTSPGLLEKRFGGFGIFDFQYRFIRYRLSSL